ncbi:hypothetical protein B296_00051283 [Ensete ventricosum]|uniref:EXPERA domain-containing protein n=1 Tax=Ensete ventricosum TaxID=4639 RepID=A0A426YH83_ENSVE|nr:hypothetical protein B296_00051283 [Ensete ventricosum]
MAAAEGRHWEHPYVPKDLKLPDYVPCFLSQKDILVPYLGTSFLLVSLIWLFSGLLCFPLFLSYSRSNLIRKIRSCRTYRRSKLSKTDRLLMCWWAFTGLTHIILEGYFAFSPDFYKEKTPHFLAEVCIVTVEGITAVLEGPASLLAV